MIILLHCMCMSPHVIKKYWACEKGKIGIEFAYQLIYSNFNSACKYAPLQLERACLKGKFEYLFAWFVETAYYGIVLGGQHEGLVNVKVFGKFGLLKEIMAIMKIMGNKNNWN